ncbi:1,4-dihydroxy-6-naphthoate synthase [Taibaiella sp. KBW10]|uniref:1,4-dihydroxy-6-naphthoate synthase n=1 Tax=Taibaiella sp. KBW10 TaxID=2153357 RepID=UPI001F3F5CE1|nr:1,4-dihydroxy-6-naphthoate synthase [Taibaiella sp. KBW10]
MRKNYAFFMQLSLGFSPCPNDTFIFDDMVNQPHPEQGLSFQYVMEDVETLNQWAIEGKLDITKVSYNAFLHLTDTYALLDTGSALGRGVGPLLITTKETFNSISDVSSFLKQAKIAIPGIHTTANLLLSLAFPEAQQKTEVLFSEIEQAVLQGTFDAGLIIHENRFTYADRGLAKIMDCGEWWEQETGAAIPLGGIIIKKSLPEAVKQQVQQMIGESLRKSWDQYPDLSGFVQEHAQEMSEEVMRKHINLYVNEYSASLGTEGKKAIDILFQKAFQAQIIKILPEQYRL